MSNPFLANLLAGKAPAPVGDATASAAAPALEVLADTGDRAQNLKNLLGQFATKAGIAVGTTRVNPSEAVQVLAAKTTPEVAGVAEDVDAEEPGPDVTPPTSKPQDIIDAEQAKRTRRTAAVVQAELDIALERIAVLEKTGSSTAALTELAQCQRQLADASDAITQLREEAKICEADKAKAHKRADDAEATVLQAVEAIEELQKRQLRAHPTLGVAELCDALKALGFEPTLRRL